VTAFDGASPLSTPSCVRETRGSRACLSHPRRQRELQLYVIAVPHPAYYHEEKVGPAFGTRCALHAVAIIVIKGLSGAVVQKLFLRRRLVDPLPLYKRI
jgi:hypothetical protein